MRRGHGRYASRPPSGEALGALDQVLSVCAVHDDYGWDTVDVLESYVDAAFGIISQILLVEHLETAELLSSFEKLVPGDSAVEEEIDAACEAISGAAVSEPEKIAAIAKDVLAQSLEVANYFREAFDCKMRVVQVQARRIEKVARLV